MRLLYLLRLWLFFMICVSVFGKGEKQVSSLLKEVHGLCDLVELRLDLMEELDDHILKQIIAQADLPVIVTNRASWEGGRFQGSEQERIAFLEKALEYGANFIDIEFATEEGPRKRLIQTAHNKGAKVILSHHDFEKTPPSDELSTLFDNMVLQDPSVNIIKIVTYASNRLDFLRLAALYPKAKKAGRQLIAFCMGRQGCYSRIYCVHLGSFLTFASIEASLSSAPGQIPVRMMKDILSRIEAVC